MKRSWLAGPALTIMAASTSVIAQTPASPQLGVPRIGVVAGFNLARLSGKDVTGASNKTGFNGGAYVAIPLSPQFDIQPELLYTRKGVKLSDAGTNIALTLSYIEVPALARMNFASSSGVTPQLYAGPAIAFKTTCKLDATSQGVSVKLNCDDIPSATAGTTSVSTVDFGVVVGGGLSFAVGGHQGTIGARYDFGLKNVASNSDAKNRALSFLATFEVPLPGR